jgi:hypothetical protein
MNAAIPLETKPGLYLPDLELWLDSRRARENGFVSHAHADHFARHKNILCSVPTAHILRARFNVAEDRLNPQPFHEPLEVGPFQLQLLPAGHIFGSAMLHVTRKSDGASLLYTGDFKMRRSLTAGEPVFRRADTLVMETTFGGPFWVFPSDTEVTGQVLNFVNESLEAGQVPALLAYSLGKAQEALAMLDQAGIPAVQQPASRSSRAGPSTRARSTVSASMRLSPCPITPIFPASSRLLSASIQDASSPSTATLASSQPSSEGNTTTLGPSTAETRWSWTCYLAASIGRDVSVH